MVASVLAWADAVSYTISTATMSAAAIAANALGKYPVLATLSSPCSIRERSAEQE